MLQQGASWADRANGRRYGTDRSYGSDGRGLNRTYWRWRYWTYGFRGTDRTFARTDRTYGLWRLNGSLGWPYRTDGTDRLLRSRSRDANRDHGPA